MSLLAPVVSPGSLPPPATRRPLTQPAPPHSPPLLAPRHPPPPAKAHPPPAPPHSPPLPAPRHPPPPAQAHPPPPPAPRHPPPPSQAHPSPTPPHSPPPPAPRHPPPPSQAHPPPAPATPETPSTSPPARATPPPNGGKETGTSIGLIVGIGIGGIIVLLAVCVFVIFRWRRSAIPPQGPKVEKAHPPLSPGISFGFTKSTFTYEELAMATDGFSDSNLLGQGGFGYVHKGVLPNKKQVAIKQLKVGSKQGENEFKAEVKIISRIHHKHLVSLVGYYLSGAQMMLVYEFVPNNTLEFHLHGKGRPTMSWEIRMKIALGSAKGLTYLHEECQPKIIHRDIKAANILLDYNFEAKIADFGLAKFSSDSDTHISTRVMGTFGYLAPEYASSGQLTEKSDIFSFGVVLLELITGRRPIDKTRSLTDDSMVDWAKPLLTQSLEDGNFDTLVDPRLQDYNYSEMTQMVACAAVCARHSAQRRPRMSQIVRTLEGNISLADLNDGIRPGHSTVSSPFGSSD